MTVTTQLAELLLWALILHAALACIDVLLNHELIVQLPRQANAVTEQWLHSARELTFALIFVSLAWAQWHGHAIWLIAALLGIELLITVIDTVVEVDTRKLPVSERVSHVLLYMNFGVICLLFAQVSADWFERPTALHYAYHGIPSWILSLAACGALLFCVRDAAAAINLHKQTRAWD